MVGKVVSALSSPEALPLGLGGYYGERVLYCRDLIGPKRVLGPKALRSPNEFFGSRASDLFQLFHQLCCISWIKSLRNGDFQALKSAQKGV